MPRKSDSIAINNEKYDRRVKLTEDDKKSIKSEYELGLSSIRGLARKYGVDKRLIQFILFPERQVVARAGYAERQKDGRYYDREKHNEAMKRHRDHKKELWNRGLLMPEGTK